MNNECIAVLHNNILQTFENINTYSLAMHEKYVLEGKVSREIIFDNIQDKITFPKVNEQKEILLQETFLSHLWSFTYSTFVIYEEAIQKRMLEKTFTGEILLNTPLLLRAKKLYDWSIGLKDMYSKWDLNLPNPKKHNCTEEQIYAEKINNIYQSTVSYFLCHELSHLINEDISFVKEKHLGMNTKTEKNKEDDRLLIIMVENEADNFAFNMLIGNDIDEKDKIEKALSIMIALCSSLILSNKSTIVQIKHPDIDDRFLAMMQKLNFENIENEFYIWYLGCLMFGMYFEKENYSINIPIEETHKDLFFKYLHEIDEFKNKIRNSLSN